MDIDTERFYPVSEIPDIRKALSNIYVYTFFIDSKDRLWCIKVNGFLSIHLKTGNIKEYNYDTSDEQPAGYLNDITDIFENHKGELFFASLGSGILRYNSDSDNFDNYTEEKNGLPSNYCYHISEAPSGKLIVLYNKGFAFFNPEKPDEYSFRTSSGFPIIGFNKGNTVYVTRDKEIFIGGINGLISFRENDLYKINKDYTLFFDKLFINNKQVYPGDKFGILEKTLPLCSKIDLKYNQNNISVEFATSNYLQIMKHNYEYKLEGFDKDWISTDTKIISYTNLNTGTYTLYVREALKQGQKDGKIHSLIFKIKPPFLLTTTAFIVYGILLLLVIVGIFRFYIWRTKLKTTLEFERKDKERIEELNRTKLRFFTNVSHEFRTPLTLIIGQVETLLLQSDLNLKIHNKLVKIHKNTNHLLSLISELLEFRKQEQGFYKLNIKHVELIAYLKNIYHSFHDHAAQKQIKYKLDYSEKEIHVYIDPVHLQKAIFNLLSNAFKYTPPGGEITLKVKIQEQEVLIRITDNGIGIPPESLNRIFERFYQLEYRSSGLTLGTGIGLALTKEIIIAHKGKISVESTLNEGSIFTISLKMGTAHFSEEELHYGEPTANETTQNIDIQYIDDIENGKESVFTEGNITGNKEKPVVLIVEDNEALLEVLTESFAPYYNLHTVLNGKKGLEMVHKIQPDLVISDIIMPEISGKELCYRLKNNVITSHIPVILLTAQVTDNQMIEGYLFGADDYITKPFNIKLLIARCNNLVKNRQLLYKKFANQEENVTTSNNTIVEQDRELIDKTIKIIKENFSNPEFDMNKLGTALGMGRSKLYTKIKEITGFSPNELTLNVKLQEAVNLLNTKSRMNISEIAYELGFSSTKYFTKCFKTFYGIVPQEWRRRNKK
jgi:signal transduction histidine kinase/DNA-binding response OmpR family regulator